MAAALTPLGAKLAIYFPWSAFNQYRQYGQVGQSNQPTIYYKWWIALKRFSGIVKGSSTTAIRLEITQNSL